MMIRLQGIRLVAIAAGVLAATEASAQTLCANPNAVCRTRIDTACLQGNRVGASSIEVDDVAANGNCATQFDAYRQCLTDVAQQCANNGEARSSGGRCSGEDARQLYDVIAESNDVDELAAFVEACPNTPQARLAQVKLRRLRGSQAAPIDPSKTLPTAFKSPAFPRSEDLRAAQRELRRLKLYSGDVDGDWGGGSRNALMAFQRQAGLSPTEGQLTEESLLALYDAQARPNSQPTANLPSAAEVIVSKGSWLKKFNINIESDPAPTYFTHYFMASESSEWIAGGSILIGDKWDQSMSPFFRIIHGSASDEYNRYARHLDTMSYLGPEWRPEFLQLSEEVRKQLGQEHLEMRVQGP
ncbi:MAG: peptidoglycan-binding protein [Rhodobacteraceae bacterium]|nr:peptidoglycan-binding protein [Paracoccaceae bacterium]